MSVMTNETGNFASTTGFSGTRVAVANADAGVGPAVVAMFQEMGATVATDTAQADADAAIALDKTYAVKFLDECESQLGGLDVLVVSAPPVRNKPVLEMTPDELRSVVEADLVFPALLMQEAARRMGARGYGRIIAFSSMSAKTGVHHNVAPYAAAKGGLLAFMRVLAAEMAETGVTVNAIATALFEPQVAAMPEEKKARLKAGIPVGRFGRSSEAAHAVLYLSSPQAGFVTGECMNLSGGRFMD